MNISSPELEDRNEVALRLKRFRAEHGLTQVQAAEQLGIPLRTLQNWEISRNVPRGFALKVLLSELSSGKQSAQPKKVRRVPVAKKEIPEIHPNSFQGLSDAHLL